MGKNRPIAHIMSDDGDPYQQLVMAVILRACEDARDGDREAAAWLRSDGAQYLYDALDISPMFRARLAALGPPGAVYQYQYALPLAAVA